MAEINKCLSLVLLGKIGAGKSSSGNTILGRQAFESNSSLTSVTQDVVVESGTVCDRLVTVYDTPGLFNPKRSDKEIQEIHASVLQECESGHCVFLLVIKVGRFTEKESKTVEIIENLLEEKRLKKTWILFTGKDELEDEDMTIEKFINETEPLKNLIQKYDQRYHVFNNEITGDATQVQELLTKICSPTTHPDTIVRIVLLGSSVSENSLVGNFILGRAAFDSEAPPDVVERVRGRLKDREVMVINSPQLLQRNISDHQITHTVRECVFLSHPGPHVILLLLKHEPCSAEDQERVEKVLLSFSEQVYQHTMVLTTQEPTETSDVLQNIIQKCANRHFSLQRSSSPEDLLQTLEHIEKMNDGRYLHCAEASQCFTMKRPSTERLSEAVKLNLVVCGSDRMLKSSVSEQILQQTDRRSDVDLHDRQISVIELPALTGLSEEEVMRQTLRCVSLCHPGVHVFIIIIPDAPLNNEDRAETEKIQKIFSSRINKHILILIKQSSERQTEELSEETQSVIQRFGGRHQLFGPKTQVSTLMENIEQMLEENRGECFSTEMFLETQMKKLMKYEEMKKKTDSLEKHLLSQGSSEKEDELRIVLLGKTGAGKSATGNTILGREAFTAEESFESITKESQRESCEINGRRVTVIDTPGLFDTELSNEEIQREITHCVSMILPGPHVFLLLVPLGRFTKEEETSVKIIQETFGENSLMFTMVLFTRGDFLKKKTIDQCLGKPGSPLMKLIEACGNRYHVFNNNQPEDRTQVTDLLQKIDDMLKENGASFYSCKMFREMEREKQELQIKILMDRVREREEEMEKLNREREQEMEKLNREREQEMEKLKREREEMEKLNREREQEMEKLEEERERMKMMMEEERQNQDRERKRREEELKREIREEEKHQRETRDELRRERETFRHDIEEMKKEREKLQIKYETEIDKLMNRIENERKRREEEFNEREERYKRDMKDKEESVEILHEERKREREEWEKQKQEEKMRREEEDEKSREKEQREQAEFNHRLKEERERMEREKEDLQSKHEEEENKMKILMEKLNRQREEEMKKHEEEKVREMKEEMKREREEWEKQKLEEKRRREEEDVERRQKDKQLEDSEKRLKEERKMREDQQKSLEEKLRLSEEQHEEELKRRRVQWREEYEREREEIKKIRSQTDPSLQVSAYRKLETEYSKWSWSLRSAMMETENKLHNMIENEVIHEIEEQDLHRELKKTREEVEKSMSEIFEKDRDKDILIQWKTSFEIKIRDLKENIVRETQRKLNEILHQRDLKKKIDAQRIHHENTLCEKSKELALKLRDRTNDEETLKKEFDLFWDQNVNMIIRDTPTIRDIDMMRDVREILSNIYESVSVERLRKSRNILYVQSYSDYVRSKRSSGTTHPGIYKLRMFKIWGLFLSREDEAQIRSFVTDVVQQTDRMIQSFNISKIGYNIICIQQITDYIKTRVTQHEEEQVRYVFNKEFFIDLVLSICKRANKMITDQHTLFREANDPLLYLKKKREEYYSIFQKYCHGSASAAMFGEIICQKLKESIEQSVYKRTARDLAGEMRSNCESLNGNRSHLEKHILKTLAEEEDFDKYMNYIHHPRDHFKSFIRDEVSRYITDQFSLSVLPKMKENIILLEQKIMRAAHQSTERVQENRGDFGLWLKSFTQLISDDLIFSEKHLSGVNHDDVDDFNLLEDVMRKELPAITTDISSSFNTNTFHLKLDYKFRPDDLLIDLFCQCCWVQCPFCKAICTNTTEDHPGDHSVTFHRVRGINGTCYNSTHNLCTDICTNMEANHFNVNTPDARCVWKKIKIAGAQNAIWSFTPGLSNLTYWKWFVCRFQSNLEKHYNQTFQGSGMIPDGWRKYTKQDAFKSLDEYI